MSKDSPETKFQWHPNTIVRPKSGNMFQIYCAPYRTNVVAHGSAIFELASFLTEPKSLIQIREAFPGSEFRLADSTEFKLWDCCYNNSNMFSGDPTLETHALESALEFLHETRMVRLEDESMWQQEKAHFGQRSVGSFHERIASEALFKRKTVSNWWVDQKFSSPTQTTETPYKYVQEAFLDEFFDSKLTGKKVLEIGCGTGFYTKKMSRHAEAVVGFDYNKSYIETAKSDNSASQNLNYFVADITDFDSLKDHKGQFDYVFIIDTLLFLFGNGFQKDLEDKRRVIIENIASLIAPGGTLAIMDPHPFNFLMPWFGDSDQPFGLVAEYKNRKFKVTPTLQEMSELLSGANLAIAKITEPTVKESYKSINREVYEFNSEYPQWWFIEAKMLQP
jgi:2-polyprenyl-3-methyl-5-hydroxy-6-metoxy-1,4-benzoquinol methylase